MKSTSFLFRLSKPDDLNILAYNIYLYSDYLLCSINKSFVIINLLKKFYLGVSGVPTSTKTGDPSTSSRLRQRINSGIPIPESDIMLRTVPFAELAKVRPVLSDQFII